MTLVARTLAIGLVALAGVLAGFLSYRRAHRAPAAATVSAAAHLSAAPAASADSSAATAPGGDDVPHSRPIPSTVPELALPDLSGHQTSLRQFLGHPLIINFWATWCAPCRRELPLLQQLRRAHRAEGLEIVGIAVDFRAAVVAYTARQPIDYPVLIGEDAGLAATEQFGMQAVLPFSVFADAQGRIVAVKVGELHRDEAAYILDAMRELAAGHLSLPEAQAGITQRLRELAVAHAKGGSDDS
jgi:thiol-disulfide isomerase/thioredoxin